MSAAVFKSLAELEAGLDRVLQSPHDSGTLRMIVRRPAENERETLRDGDLCLTFGLVGDCWSMGPGRPDPAAQVTLMNCRAIELIAGDERNWPPAGDQLFVDLSLAEDDVPAGTRLAIGTAVVEVTAEPHTGCKKFAARYGTDAVKFVNSPRGKQLHLRGVNARVVQAGRIQVGDVVRKLTT